ncbi:MAG: DUF3108 domain-containing protein [Caldiserica bacterium]|nr:DUF3108 domain-containing protein [Caldisericota bacterium]
MRYLLVVLLVFAFFLPSFAEEWHYVVKWMGIKVARMNVKIEEQSSSVQMKANLRTVGLFSLTRRINDSMESTWDKEKRELKYFKEVLNERSYHYSEEVIFKEGKAYKGNNITPIPPNTYDPLALFYSLRYISPEKKEWQYNLYVHGKVRAISLIVLKEERLKIYNDYFQTIKVVPRTNFKELEGAARKVKKLELWLAGEKRVPVLMEMKSSFGRITFLLENRKQFVQDSKQ